MRDRTHMARESRAPMPKVVRLAVSSRKHASRPLTDLGYGVGGNLRGMAEAEDHSGEDG